MPDSFYKSSDQILVVNRTVNVTSWSTRQYIYMFDFEFRALTVITDYTSSKEASEVLPFPALDPETLRSMRDKLIDLGGNPKPLEPEADPKQAFVIPKPLRRNDNGPKP